MWDVTVLFAVLNRATLIWHVLCCVMCRAALCMAAHPVVLCCTKLIACRILLYCISLYDTYTAATIAHSPYVMDCVSGAHMYLSVPLTQSIYVHGSKGTVVEFWWCCRRSVSLAVGFSLTQCTLQYCICMSSGYCSLLPAVCTAAETWCNICISCYLGWDLTAVLRSSAELFTLIVTVVS